MATPALSNVRTSAAWARIVPFQRPQPGDNLSLGVSWGFVSMPLIAAVVSMTMVASLVASATRVPSHAPDVSVIVQEAAQAVYQPIEATLNLGGKVVRQLPIIHAFEARLPADRVYALSHSPGVVSVSPNYGIHLNMDGDGYDATSNMGSMFNVTKAIGAQTLWDEGITGQGVDVALVDTGVDPQPDFAGRLINGVDVSFDSQSYKRRYGDGFGHGTHMAGIIAGNDSRMPAGDTYLDPNYFDGVAPDARIVNVKAASKNGVTDVSQVIAGIDWVVQHRHDNGMNIRVLNLSFGTDGTQKYTIDPLAYAVERAWRAGIVVVAAAGNSGMGTVKLDDPAYDPFVIAVGASQFNGDLSADDDTVTDFSSRGDANRHPDLVAPGKSIISLRVAGSYIDSRNPNARVGTAFFKGSGTSQAAAVVSGAAALLLSDRPGLSPDDVKALFTDNADAMPTADPDAAGAGRIDVAAADAASVPSDDDQGFNQSTGTGSIQASRGDEVIQDLTGVPLTGDVDIFGQPYNVATSGNSWSGGWWNGNKWSGNSWSGNSWSGTAWQGNSWSGNSWSSGAWMGNSWSTAVWSGNSWSGCMWSSAGYDD